MGDVWRCHKHQFQGECWHGRCPVCKKGVTAFDHSAEAAQAIVDAHIAKEHPDFPAGGAMGGEG